MADIYQSFHELASCEREGEDWTREHMDRGSRILVMAPHGGWIEPQTTELARAVAGDTYSLYTFQGTKPSGNQALHLTSHRFDEPLALEAVEKAESVLCFHGERTRTQPFVMVGGLWERMRFGLLDALDAAGFLVEVPKPGLMGEHPRNLCNRGRLGAGGQLEISEGLRTLLRQEPVEMDRFVRAVRGVLREFEEEGDWRVSAPKPPQSRPGNPHGS